MGWSSQPGVVHGGPDYSGPVRLDQPALRAIENAGVLAPLHNASALAVIRAATARYPELPQFAVFDTAFHHDLPEHARHYAVPAQWHEQYGVRRYGFHGISHKSVARQAAAFLYRPLGDLRVVLSRSDAGDPAAQRAISVYCYRIRKYIGAYIAALGGIDVLVFTGGVGENADVVRATACQGLEAFGIVIDCHKNALRFSGQPRAIHAAVAAVAVLVMPSDEDLEIARQVHRFIAGF